MVSQAGKQILQRGNKHNRGFLPLVLYLRPLLICHRPHISINHMICIRVIVVQPFLLRVAPQLSSDSVSSSSEVIPLSSDLLHPALLVSPIEHE